MKSMLCRMTLGAAAAAMGLAITGCAGITDADAQQLLMKNIGDASVTVFPAFCRKGSEPTHDGDAAVRIAEFLASDKLATATVSDAHVPITGPWHGNQAKMLRESAEAFVKYLSEHPVETDYALLPEYLFGRSEAGGVHCYVIDKQGKVAYAMLLNSHHKPFSDARPKTPADCTEVLIGVLRDDLKRAADES